MNEEKALIISGVIILIVGVLVIVLYIVLTRKKPACSASSCKIDNFTDSVTLKEDILSIGTSKIDILNANRNKTAYITRKSDVTSANVTYQLISYDDEGCAQVDGVQNVWNITGKQYTFTPCASGSGSVAVSSQYRIQESILSLNNSFYSTFSVYRMVDGTPQQFAVSTRTGFFDTTLSINDLNGNLLCTAIRPPFSLTGDSWTFTNRNVNIIPMWLLIFMASLITISAREKRRS